MSERPRRLAPMMALMVTVLGVPGTCAKRHPTSDASASSASTSSVSSPSGSSIVAAPDAAASAAAAKAAANAVAVERAKQWLADIRWLVAHGVSVNPSNTGDGDVVSKCDAVEAARSSPGKDPDPELARILTEASEVCAFDVPLLTASEAIDHMRFTPSQASRLLMCDVAAREIARARAVKPNDFRVRNVDARRSAACK